MRIEVTTQDGSPLGPPQVGMVYPMRGGRGGSRGHMNVLIAITEPQQFIGQYGVLISITPNGDVVGCTKYAMHYLEELTPMGFVDGLDELSLVMRPL